MYKKRKVTTNIREYFDKILGKKSKSFESLRQEFKHYGLSNRDKIIYLIEEDGIGVGFFAMYRAWIEYLYFADICGYTPVVCAGKHYIYSEENLIHGESNAFEYYFKQPAEVSVSEAKSSSRVVLSDLVHRFMVELIFTGTYAHYKYTKKYMHEMSRIVRKYMVFNQHTQNFIDQGVERLGLRNEKTLGVHVRGTDFRAKYNNHPICIMEEEYFIEIDKVLSQNDYKKIFLATDDERVLNNFINKYGELLCFYEDTKRSRNNHSVAFSENNRNNHKYKLGLEVIRDMYTLSICSGLIAGISQVAICAQINKMSRKERYENIKIIDKGINKNNHIFKYNPQKQ